MKLVGTVQDGKNDANFWLTRFAAAYERWLGEPIFPGSLNLKIGVAFDWHARELLPFRRTFSLKPFGGERDLFIVPCRIQIPKEQRAYLWTTTTAADDQSGRHVIELISPVHLRKALGLVNGSTVELQYPEPWPGANEIRFIRPAVTR